jgi:leucyl-tRNA synthetase
VVQINGKVRAKIEASADAAESELLALARADERISGQIDGKEIVKEIVVPGRLVNIVAR